MGSKAHIPEGVFVPPEVAMFGNRYVRRWQASATTYRTYASWWQLFYTAAVNRFTWEGLPDEIDPRYLECGLFTCGTMALTKSIRTEGLLDYFVASYATEGRLDIYNNPNRIRLTSANGRQWVRHANMWVSRRGNQHGSVSCLRQPNACVCWDSTTRLPLFNSIDLLCRRLAEFDVTIDQHVRANRVPYVIAVPEEGRANAETMYNSIDRGDPAIYVTPNAAGIVQVQVLATGVNYQADKMLNDELKLVSLGYTMLGIDNNAAAEKKERVQTAETVANNEQFLIQRRSAQAARDRFSEQCERVFGICPEAVWSVPHTWDSGEAPGYNPALATTSAQASYGTSRGLLESPTQGGGQSGNAL